MAEPSFKYCQISWTPTENADGTVTLKAPPNPRELLVTEEGVFECTDGKPVEKFDGNVAMLSRVRSTIAKAKLAP